MQTYQRESKPIQDVYAQVTQLFHTAPDLLDDFKQFLPESAAQAKAQAAARAAADEASTSNTRADYNGAQIAQAQTPRPTTKMPPMGQFDPPSTSKENKKRRGGLAVQTSGPAAAPNTTEVIGPTSGGRSAGVQIGNANKVSGSPSVKVVPTSGVNSFCEPATPRSFLLHVPFLFHTKSLCQHVCYFFLF